MKSILPKYEDLNKVAMDAAERVFKKENKKQQKKQKKEKR